MAVVGWSRAQKDAFLTQQFDAQDRAWRDRFPEDDRAFMVIEVDGEPAGRLYLARLPGELRVVDLAVLPEHRGRGLGTGLLGDVIGLADAEERAVTLHVERWNPAARLYERLGFRPVATGEVYVLMERPAQLNTAS